MFRHRLAAVAFGAALALAACGGSGGSSTSPGATGPAATSAPAATPTTAPTPTPTPSAAALSASATVEPTGLAGAPDPCAMVTSAEASALAGVTYGAGKEDTTSGNGRSCVYGYQTPHVFMVFTGLAPDEATAKAEEAAFKKQLEEGAAQAGAAFKETVTELPDWQPGVDAAVVSGGATISGVSFAASAMYLLKGTTFVGFSFLGLGTAAPSSADLEAQGLKVLGRI